MPAQPDAPFLETSRQVVDGFVYESASGQIVIDEHQTDEAHLRSKATHAEQPLYRCRTYVRDLVPKEWCHKPGKILIDRTVASTGEVVAVQIAFIPKLPVDDQAKR